MKRKSNFVPEKKFLKPAREGLVCRDPVTKQPLNAEGEEKSMSTFWRRQIKDGDVVEVQPQAQTSPASPEE